MVLAAKRICEVPGLPVGYSVEFFDDNGETLAASTLEEKASLEAREGEARAKIQGCSLCPFRERRDSRKSQNMDKKRCSYFPTVRMHRQAIGRASAAKMCASWKVAPMRRRAHWLYCQNHNWPQT